MFISILKISTKDNLATIYSITDGTDSIITFLHMEKAFELANSKAIINILASKGISGKLLSWTQISPKHEGSLQTLRHPI